MISLITKYRKKKIRFSEELHRIVMENIVDAIFITDDDGKFTYICENVPHILGYTVEEVQKMGNISKILGKSLFSIDELVDKKIIPGLETIIFDKAKCVELSA